MGHDEDLRGTGWPQGLHLAAGLEMEGSAVLETLLSDDCRLAMKTFVDLPVQERRDWLERTLDQPQYSGR